MNESQGNIYPSDIKNTSSKEESVSHRAMSGTISSVQAPRQSGLKKPRPLRSVSVASAVQNEKKDILSPLSVESTDNQAIAAVSNQPSPMCREIAAMSAAVAEASVKANLPIPRSASCDEAQTLLSAASHRMGLTSNASLYMRANSTPSGHTEFSGRPRPLYQRSYSSEGSSAGQEIPSDLSNNNRTVLHCYGYAVDRGSQSYRTPLSDGQHYDINSRGQELNMRDRTTSTCTYKIGHKQSFLKPKSSTSNIAGLSGLDDGIVVATLRTVKGEEFVVSAEHIQTIICVTRVLVSELGAKIEKLEAFPKDDGHDSSLSSEDSPHHRAKHPKQNNKSTKYSKEKLLQLSQSELSHQPPGSWRLLSQAHPEVCVPASKVNEYFDPADFHPSDGTLFVEKPGQGPRPKLDSANF